MHGEPFVDTIEPGFGTQSPDTTPPHFEGVPDAPAAAIRRNEWCSEAETLLAVVRTYLAPADVEMVAKGIDFGGLAHAGQVRRSGEAYFVHPIAAATTLARMQLDRDSVIAGLLHDVPEDTTVALDVVAKHFGADVAKLVDGVTKLDRLRLATGDSAIKEKQEQAENLRKMVLAMVDDVRVVIIKLADRLHNMQTLEFQTPEKQFKKATETLEIFAPLANRLGMWNLKWQLEDLSFKYLYPDEYAKLAALFDDRRESREKYLQRVVKTTEKAMADANIEAEVTARSKHMYSIWKKMERKHRSFDQIYDVLAVRIIVPEIRDCYAALGIIHTLWRPLPGEFDDYIASPKESTYQSLHTTVVSLEGRPLEVQIRTHEMHHLAEYGIAAHWRYKEVAHGSSKASGKRDTNFENKIAWLRRLLDWRNDDAQEFVDSLKTDVFQDQVYVFSPKGDIFDLPTGSTAIDFAYRIHTDLGHTIGGAKVNNRQVPLDHTLQNGDVVTVIRSHQRKGPSRDWLNPNLGYVHTAGAREKIKQWFRRQERDENIVHGRDILDTELKRLGLEPIKSSQELVLKKFDKFAKLDDLLAAIGYGGVTVPQLTARLAEMVKEDGKLGLPEFATPTVSVVPTHASPLLMPSDAVEVHGVRGLLTNPAACCHPAPGDTIMGYVTRGRGVTIHRASCRNIANINDADRLIPVDWGSSSSQFYRVPMRVDARDRVGLLRDVSAVIADEKVNINHMNTVTPEVGRSVITFMVDVTSVEQFTNLLARLQSVKGIEDVRRNAPADNTAPALPAPIAPIALPAPVRV